MSGFQYSLFIIVIIMMGSVGLFASDIYLPALPEMAQYFNCSQGDILDSFTVFLVGLAACQFVTGLLSDYCGRKNIVILGLFTFVIASLFCAFSTSLREFIGFRFLQAIGGGVGSVVGRAIIADRYSKKEAVKIFSTTFPVIGMSAAVAPFIGGYLTHFFHWQSTFYFIAAFGVIALLLVVFFLKDAKSQHAGPKSFTGYVDILRNASFLGYVAIICAGFCAFRSYSAASPFVFDNQGYIAKEMGHFYIVLSIAYIIGNLSAKKLVNHLSLERVLGIGFFFFVSGSVSMVISTMYFQNSPYAIILPMAVITLGNGFLFPTASAAALGSVPSAFSGMASGLMGALQFLLAAFCIDWLGDWCQGQALLMSIFIGIIVFMGFCIFLLIVSRSKLINA